MMVQALLFRFTIVSLIFCAVAPAQKEAEFASPLPTGLQLDPTGDVADLGSMPMNLVLSPNGDNAVVVLSGWRT